MPSPAAKKYHVAASGVMLLDRSEFNNKQLKFTFSEKQSIRHACLAGLVACWDGYLNNIIRDFYNIISNPLDIRFSSLHNVSYELTDRRLFYFNTPNWENSREAIYLCTGYDPIAAWTWPRRNMGVADIRVRLNETLQVRHSFAHGFSLPGVNWLKTATGRIQISKKAIADTKSLFDHLVTRTDRGLSTHIKNLYSVPNDW